MMNAMNGKVLFKDKITKVIHCINAKVQSWKKLNCFLQVEWECLILELLIHVRYQN